MYLYSAISQLGESPDLIWDALILKVKEVTLGSSGMALAKMVPGCVA